MSKILIQLEAVVDRKEIDEYYAKRVLAKESELSFFCSIEVVISEIESFPGALRRRVFLRSILRVIE